MMTQNGNTNGLRAQKSSAGTISARTKAASQPSQASQPAQRSQPSPGSQLFQPARPPARQPRPASPAKPGRQPSQRQPAPGRQPSLPARPARQPAGQPANQAQQTQPTQCPGIHFTHLCYLIKTTPSALVSTRHFENYISDYLRK